MVRHVESHQWFIVYFDSSAFSDESFKKHIWTLNSTHRVEVNDAKVYGYVSLLMATTKERIINYWIVNRVNAMTTASFLDETIKYIRKVMRKPKVLVFMDNARIHLTELMKKLAHHHRVYFVLNAANSSKMNQIEYAFEVIKWLVPESSVQRKKTYQGCQGPDEGP